MAKRHAESRPSGNALMIDKIVSGGQTGADRAALDVAQELGIAIGGWVPSGRRAEDGRVPERYAGLLEANSSAYRTRTELNVRDSDATLVLAFGPLRGGSALTAKLARAQKKPLLALDLETLSHEEASQAIRDWLVRERPRTLNVAGPRASQQPRIHAATLRILRAALSQ